MQDKIDPVLNYSFAKEQGMVLLDLGDRARIGTRGDVRAHAMLEARRALGVPVTFETMSIQDFDRRLSENYAVEGLGSEDIDDSLDREEDLESLIQDIPQTADLLDAADDAPIIRLINGLISEAVRVRASDIHVEPFEGRLSVRLRIDGVLREILSLSARVTPLLISRIKVMARLDIAEKRVPQDGRISLTIGGKALDVRVSTLPSRHGERVVLRLLDKDQAHFNVAELGMAPEILSGFKHALAEPNGIILVTGPTGSGKTTTLYAGLSLLNDQSRNILTVEDPVEYALEGIGQTQVNTKVGMTFAKGLRAILRQDPDVVMVGEIRDAETAEIAVQASLTGHLVFSTVHTNSAVAAITRLRDMGVAPFLLASTVKAILAQRLVRRLCSQCKKPVDPSAKDRELLGLKAEDQLTLYRPGGCPICSQTGYEGRIGLFELVLVDDTLQRKIHEDESEQNLAEYAFRDRDTLVENGYQHVRAGLTSLEEVMRVCRQKGEGNGGI